MPFINTRPSDRAQALPECLSPDGQTLLQSQVSGRAEQAEQLGVQLAKNLLDQGAGELLKALYQV